MSKSHFCKYCGKKMVRGRIQSYSSETGKPFYIWDCPVWAEKVLNEQRWWSGVGHSDHYSYSEEDDEYYDHKEDWI